MFYVNGKYLSCLHGEEAKLSLYVSNNVARSKYVTNVVCKIQKAVFKRVF
jgi:hypothetical protein